MSLKLVTVETDADGEFTYERRMAGVIHGIAIDIGTLTTPDITITDGVWDTAVLTVAGLAADAIYQPVAAASTVLGAASATLVPVPIFGSLKIVVTGGGANFTGTIRFLFG